MKKRLPLEKNEIIAKLNILGIEIALDLKWSPTSIVPLSVHFPHIIPQNQLNDLMNLMINGEPSIFLQKNLLFLLNVFQNIGTI